MMFALFNNKNNSYLTHPAVGIWYSDKKEVADDMLNACHKYVTAIGLEFLVKEIAVVEIDDVPVDVP